MGYKVEPKHIPKDGEELNLGLVDIIFWIILLDGGKNDV